MSVLFQATTSQQLVLDFGPVLIYNSYTCTNILTNNDVGIEADGAMLIAMQMHRYT